MSNLKQYLNHLSSHDYKISSYSKQQQTIRTYSELSNRQSTLYRSRQEEYHGDPLQSSGFSFSGSDKEKVTFSQHHWNSNSNKYLTYDPEMFMKKAQQLINNRNSHISLNNLTQLMNEALEILNMIEGQRKNLKKSRTSDVFVNKLMVFLEWVQERIQNERVRSTQRRRSKQSTDNRLIKRRQFYDRNGKVRIQIRKVINSENKTTVRK